MDLFTFLIICLFCVLFFGMGFILGFLANEYLIDSDNYFDLPTHPEFYDKDGNFIDDELLYLHFTNEENDDDDDTLEKQT